MTITQSNWRETGVLTVGQTLEFECPGHNGDGHFHKHTAQVTWTSTHPPVVEVYSTHWAPCYRFFTPMRGRDNTFYLERVHTTTHAHA
jgi:hypothetical protein